VRWIHVVAEGSMDVLGSADLALVGADFTFGKGRRHGVGAHVREDEAGAAFVPPSPPAPEVAFDREDEPVHDADETCLDEDEAACPGELPGPIVVRNHRIVLEERVLFDVDHAHVKSRGRELVAQVLRMWHAHPNWKAITIEGHTDVRGGDEYNQDLSERRAASVRAVLIKLGADAEHLTSVGFGKTRPRDDGTSEESHQRNRRVEFVIDSEDKDEP
jgi:outer membrane protein OmpA-like peptidoglycan-associated protein